MAPQSFTPADPRALDDLQLFLARAARIEEGSVRLISAGGVLAVYVSALFPAGLGDPMPTVLGLRALRIDESEAFDVVVPIASLRGRVDRAGGGRTDAHPVVSVDMPPQSPSVVWAAITPPQGGWQAHGPVSADVLERAAREGIAEVAAAVPHASGESIVRRVRAEVWGRPITGAEFLPAGAAFAALGFGFLGPGQAGSPSPRIDSFETPSWTRLSSARGHILIKRRAWTLAR